MDACHRHRPPASLASPKGRSWAQFFSWCISTICPDLYQVSARYSQMTPLCSKRVVDSQLICSRISEDLSRATDWATVWGMQFNAEKSEHLIISTKRNNTSKQRVLMDNTQIPQVTSHKHLGIHFSDTFLAEAY